ncbi:MAG: glycosyltransferase family 2 protein [Pseudoflavonifractor sp.]|nr:glycosyltransferase family 2 protein [Pseudoflavonifractor sp.]
MQPLITIIIPVHNRAHIVTRTLDSVYAQTARPLSLILVDNNSTDGSLEVLNRWADTHSSYDFSVTILSEEKPGASAARNRGLRDTITPYVMFFDSDDVMLPGHVRTILDTFHANPEADVVGNDIIHHSLSGKSRTLTFGTSLYSHIFHSSFATQRYAARTSVIRQAGEWDETLRGWDDLELGIRIHLKASPRTIKIKTAPTVETFHQVESLSGTEFASRPHEWETALDRCTVHLSDGLHTRELRYIELRRVILAAHYRREGSPESARLLGEVMSREKNRLRRIFYRIAYYYTAAGGRGIAIPARWVL